MTSQSETVIVLRDGDGQYYCLTAAMLEQARVPADRAAAIEEALAGDVSGFAAYVAPSLLATPVQSVSRFQDRMLNPQPLPPRYSGLAEVGIIVVGG